MKLCNVASARTLCLPKRPVTSFHDTQSLLHCTSVCSTRQPDLYVTCIHIHGAMQHRPQASGITSRSPPYTDGHPGVSALSISKITGTESNPQTTGSSGQEKCLEGTPRRYLQAAWGQRSTNPFQRQPCREKATPARGPAKKAHTYKYNQFCR